MAIDHDSPFKELRLKNRRIMGGGGPEPEDDETAATAADGGEQWPRWLRPLLSARFFAHCKVHANSHCSGECNMFCLDCAAAGAGAAAGESAALCSLCIAGSHGQHHTIQIRRSSYHDVIRVPDIARFMDIAGVQTYVINSARVVFLNERPQHKPGKSNSGAGGGGGANICEVCSRSLLDNFRFCSLGCKLIGCSPDAAAARKKKRLRHASDSDDSRTNAAAKRSFTPSTPPPPPPPAKRRKGIPHRAPFGSLII
uniref:PLATZ transcription factor family protein n=1 Tax=Leersia perrieri TaxID=77586 RepID=A0A0D9XMU4_9ORYZ